MHVEWALVEATTSGHRSLQDFESADTRAIDGAALCTSAPSPSSPSHDNRHAHKQRMRGCSSSTYSRITSNAAARRSGGVARVTPPPCSSSATAHIRQRFAVELCENILGLSVGWPLSAKTVRKRKLQATPAVTVASVPVDGLWLGPVPVASSLAGSAAALASGSGFSAPRPPPLLPPSLQPPPLQPPRLQLPPLLPRPLPPLPPLLPLPSSSTSGRGAVAAPVFVAREDHSGKCSNCKTAFAIYGGEGGGDRGPDGLCRGCGGGSTCTLC